MRLELTESTKQFIEFLTEEDRAKATITETYFESDDENISNKLKEYIKIRLTKVGRAVAETTTKFREDHPEYFE